MVYAYVGARLAAGHISFEDIGDPLDVDSIIELPVVEAAYYEGEIEGTADVLDVRFGSVWTNISHKLFKNLNIGYGDFVEVSIRNDTRFVYKNFITYARSFADVHAGESLVYVNSLQNMAIAINLGSFAKAYNIGTGTSWKIKFKKAPRMVYEK